MLRDRSVEDLARDINTTSVKYSDAIDRTEALATAAPSLPPDPRAGSSLPPPLRKKLAMVRFLVDAFWED
jgi:hypothetical protein